VERTDFEEFPTLLPWPIFKKYPILTGQVLFNAEREVSEKLPKKKKRRRGGGGEGREGGGEKRKKKRGGRYTPTRYSRPS